MVMFSDSFNSDAFNTGCRAPTSRGLLYPQFREFRGHSECRPPGLWVLVRPGQASLQSRGVMQGPGVRK